MINEERLLQEFLELVQIDSETKNEGQIAKILKDKESAILEIRKEVAQLSISIAEKVLLKELSDKKAQNAYIETLLKENKSLS